MVLVEHRFPLVCSSCRATEGMPFKAETMANGFTCIHIRCRGCSAQWTLELEPTEVTLARKIDRRAD